MPSARVLNSDGPPMTRLFARGARSEIAFRWYLAAVAEVTVTESLSCADAELRISSEDGSFAFRSALTSAVVAAVLFLSTEVVSSAPLYSGRMLIAPETICG